MLIKIQFLSLLFILYTFHVCYSKLIMVQVTVRHADRTPYKGNESLYYQNDPYKEQDWFPDGPMAITKTGKRNAYNFGVFLRKRYQSLIGTTYNPRSVYFRAAKGSRTEISAQVVASALFPPSPEQNWNPKLVWLPIPIHVKPMDRDVLNYPMIGCTNYQIDRSQAYIDIHRIFEVLSDVRNIFNYLTVNTGTNYTICTQVWMLYNQLASYASLNLTLEPWTSKIFSNGKLADVAAMEYILQTYTTRMKRLLGGVWIKTFLDSADSLLNKKTSQTKGYFYITNEIQVAAILNTLGVFKTHVPHYCNAIMFEMHEIDNEYYVKVIYRNEGIIEDVIIPGCEKSMCLLSTFKTALKEVTLTDFETDCGEHGNFAVVELFFKN